LEDAQETLCKSEAPNGESVMKKCDLLWYNSSTGESQVWYMDGHRLVDRGTVGRGGNAALVGPPFSIVGLGDMNGNGKADIVWYNSSTASVLQQSLMEEQAMAQWIADHLNPTMLRYVERYASGETAGR
jgi:hypothetical protein